MSSHSFTEFHKVYKTLSSHNKVIIDDILDQLTLYAHQKKFHQSIDTVSHTSKNTYIERQLYSTVCLLSLYYGIEYDLKSD